MKLINLFHSLFAFASSSLILLLIFFSGCRENVAAIRTQEDAKPFAELMAEEIPPCFPGLVMGEFDFTYGFEDDVSPEFRDGVKCFFSATPPPLSENLSELIPEDDQQAIRKGLKEITSRNFMSGTNFLPKQLCQFPWKDYLDDSHLNNPLPFLVRLEGPFLRADMNRQAIHKNREWVEKSYFHAPSDQYGTFATTSSPYTYHFETWNLYRFDPEFQWFLFHNRMQVHYHPDGNLDHVLIYRSLADKKCFEEVGGMDEIYWLRFQYDPEEASPNSLVIHNLRTMVQKANDEPWSVRCEGSKVTFDQ